MKRTVVTGELSPLTYRRLGSPRPEAEPTRLPLPEHLRKILLDTYLWSLYLDLLAGHAAEWPGPERRARISWPPLDASIMAFLPVFYPVFKSSLDPVPPECSSVSNYTTIQSLASKSSTLGGGRSQVS